MTGDAAHGSLTADRATREGGVSEGHDPLDEAATGARIRALHRRGVIDASTLDALLARASAGPDAAGWALVLDRLLLALGAGLCVAAVIYFFAGNWAALGAAEKLGSAIAAVLAAGGWALWAPDRRSGRVALTAAGGLTGALLAVYGQVYQTGADAWTLFAAWAGLLVPWVLASRFEPLIALWVLVGDLALWLAIEQGAVSAGADGRPGEIAQWVMVAGPPALAWAVAEALPEARRPARWLVRVFGVGCYAALTVAGLVAILDGGGEQSWAALLGVAVALVGGGWSLGVGRRRPIDLVLATAALTSAIVLVTVALARVVFEAWDLEQGGLLLLAFAVVGQVGGAATWLRRMWRAGAR